MQATINKPGRSVEQLVRTSDSVTSAYGNVLLCFSGQTPCSGYLDSSVDAIRRYAEAHPTGLGLIVMISADQPPPDEATRRIIIGTYVAIKTMVHGSVLVVEGEGFAASAKRSVIAMFSLVSSITFPTRVAGSISEGAVKMVKTLGPRLEPELDAASIAAAATAVRSDFP